ncbi:hypothetical protein L1987_71931 [Smallanthus sonchifolius]|uniref:Uncharacterized protein n=1 Tax=Smallanthus sonchifolius TaxID=185202 RepID=A0ACB9ASX3_9ASTR|nr:hypothetical protein L1987_71931 [Smallanthus sonchifolius]
MVGDISQGLKDLNHPLTPLAYFGATCTSLDKLLSSDPNPPAHHIHHHLLHHSPRLFSGRNPTTFPLCLLAHVCVREVMQGFQRTSVLSPASEAIASTFERFLLLAGGSNTNPKEASRAQEVLYVLDSLKDTLPLMSLNFSTNILNYFKSLLALHQLAATRRITDALYLLCLQPTVDVSPEALIDLLCSLATSVSSNEMSGDNLTFTARLLDAGMKKIMAGGSVTKSTPTIIEKLCATVESLLDYSFAAVWDMSFQVVSVMKQLHDCMGVAVVALGPETFLKFLPLNIEAQDPSEANVWFLPILKQNIVGAHLSFFNESLLDNIRVLKLQSAKVQVFLIFDGLVYSLWSLLPSLCNYPVDTAESFKDLEKELCHSLGEESDFRGVICSGLQILIQQNKRIIEGENEPSGKVSISQQRAVSAYASEVAARNLDVLRSFAREFLSTLSGVIMKSTKDDGGSLQRTIGEFASIADKGVVSRLYKNTMNKLLKVTEEAGKMQNTKGSSSMEIDNSSNDTSLSLTRAKLFDLAFLPGLGTEEIDVLFVAVEPALKDTESSIQKKAYKVLSTILEDKSEQLKREIVASFLTEIVLGLKEVKQLLKMLIKKCGLDAVKEVMPEEHMKLLTNIRKINERKERKHSANTEETKSRQSKATTSRLSRWNHTKIFSDFGDEETDNGDSEAMVFSGRHSRLTSKKSKRARKRLAEDSYEQLDDEPLDLLDREKMRSSLRTSDNLKRKLQSFKREKEITATGSDSDVRSVASRKPEKRRKTSQSGWAYTGSEYSSKKAGGDVKRKGKLEPYAYWPLDRKMVSRRPEHRAAARKGMSSVVKKLEGQTVSNALAMEGLKPKRSKKNSNHKKHG